MPKFEVSTTERVHAEKLAERTAAELKELTLAGHKVFFLTFMRLAGHLLMAAKDSLAKDET